MTEEETEEYNTELRLYAGIASVGIITKSVFTNPQDIARQSFDIAEAMIVEAKEREKHVS